MLRLEGLSRSGFTRISQAIRSARVASLLTRYRPRRVMHSAWLKSFVFTPGTRSCKSPVRPGSYLDVSDWQQLGWMGSNLTTADLQYYFTGRLTRALDSVQACLTKITNQINQIADPELKWPSGGDRPSVNLQDLTNKVHSFTHKLELLWKVRTVGLFRAWTYQLWGTSTLFCWCNKRRKPSTSLMRRE